MGLFGNILFVIILIVAIFIGIQIKSLIEVPALPILENIWWGQGNPSKTDTSIRPFKIHIPEKVLLDLNQRLRNARSLTVPLEGIQQQYGINSKLVTEIVEFWQIRYDWREREKFLNQYPQFKTNIQGLDIHFIHVKPTRTEGLKVLPLLLLHGWPGSVREFYEVIPNLTTPKKGEKFVFEVIIPSLPGYGFSQATTKPGLGAPQMAVIFRNLMDRLGYKKYYVQGGDWGALIVSIMSTLFPNRILGMHSNMCSVFNPITVAQGILGSIYPPLVIDKKYEHRLYPVGKSLEFFLSESGYLHLQASKPDTIGVSLNDSPIGLAAYILEKFITWTNPAWINKEYGGLKEKYSYTNLLDNVMIYWVTNSATTSARLYSETINKAFIDMKFDSIPTAVPSACARFAHEMIYQPDPILKTKYKNLLHTSDIDDGGHFAAFEVPELFADDLWIAIRKMEHFHKS